MISHLFRTNGEFLQILCLWYQLLRYRNGLLGLSTRGVVDPLPFTYLGVPVGAIILLKKHRRLVIEKFQAKLSSWKAHTLSFGGRLTLVKSVLNSLLTFYFSLLKCPTCVIDLLEKLRRIFLLGGNDEVRKIHWVAWDKFIAPN